MSRRYQVRQQSDEADVFESDSLYLCLRFIDGRAGFGVWDSVTRYALTDREAQLKALFE